MHEMQTPALRYLSLIATLCSICQNHGVNHIPPPPKKKNIQTHTHTKSPRWDASRRHRAAHVARQLIENLSIQNMILHPLTIKVAIAFIDGEPGQ